MPKDINDDVNNSFKKEENTEFVEFNGKKCEETVVTEVSDEDGELETRVDIKTCAANPMKFSMSEREKKNYDEIDWNK